MLVLAVSIDQLEITEELVLHGVKQGHFTEKDFIICKDNGEIKFIYSLKDKIFMTADNDIYDNAKNIIRKISSYINNTKRIEKPFSSDDNYLDLSFKWVKSL